MLPKIESQLLGCTPPIWLDTAWTTLRQVMGMTTWLWMSRSFIWMKRAARLTGSISTSASRHRRSYSAFCQRVMFRRLHLFSRLGISHEQNWDMKNCGSSPVNVVNIWRSARKRTLVSALLGSAEKNTEAGMDFTSTSMPARATACLTTIWIFWTLEFVAAWKRGLSRLPSLARTPSAPRAHPDSSRMRLALSTLKSHHVFRERKRSGALRKFEAICPLRPVMCSWIDARSTRRVMALRTAGSLRNG